LVIIANHGREIIVERKRKNRNEGSDAILRLYIYIDLNLSVCNAICLIGKS